MRLAVMWATHPLAKRRRALTKSSCPPNTVIPIASTLTTVEGVEQVEVMDHQVEHGADIGGSTGERPVPFAFDELGPNRPAAQRLKRRVEPFDVSDLEDDPFAAGDVHEVRGLFNRGCDRLFDQERNAALEKCRGDRVMMAGRDDDASGVGPVQERAVVSVGPGVVPVGDLARLGGADVGDADQLDAVHAGEDPGVRLSQMADADDRHP
jgi:hypothetical protein